MGKAGEQAEILRALGGWLDEAGVSAEGRVDIAVWEGSLSLIIQEPGEQHRQGPMTMKISALRAGATARRNSAEPPGTGGYTERLRTIGQMLDREGVELERLTALPGRYRMLGRLNSYSLAHWVTAEELGELSEQCRRHRGERAVPGRDRLAESA
jgi:hypothetical protein